MRYFADDPEVIDFTGLTQQSPQAGQMAASSGSPAYKSDTPSNWTPLLLLAIGLLLLMGRR
jgi:hypothetical protein